jgi:hypothetical protein
MLKGGKVTDIRTLLKSLPATTGMSRNRLFQVVDPNAGLTCTIATFQQKDKPFIEQRKPTLEAELRSYLAPGESLKVFQDDVEGIWFGGTIKRHNGKPVSIQAHTKEDVSFLQHANNLLNSPPKNKRPFMQTTAVSGNTLKSNSVNYSSVVQAHRTLTSKSISVQDQEGNTTTTTTKTLQVTSMVETRFQTIELEIKSQWEHQQGMDQRLLHLESRTSSIDQNIASMMEFWKITPVHKCKANNELPDNADRSMLTEVSEGTPHASTTYLLNEGEDLSCL